MLTAAPSSLAAFGRRLQRAAVERRSAAIVLCMSLFVLWAFGYNTVGLRLGIALEGVVVSRQVIKPEWYEHGTATIYVVLGRDGRYEKYAAGGTDGSLPATFLSARTSPRNDDTFVI